MATVTRADLSEAVLREIGLSRRESAEFVDSIIDAIADRLEAGEAVKISGFGTFTLRDKGERLVSTAAGICTGAAAQICTTGSVVACPASSGGIPAAPNSSASSSPSGGRCRTAGPPRDGSDPRRQPPVEPPHRAPRRTSPAPRRNRQGTMSGTILRRRDRTARPPRVEHYSSAVNSLDDHMQSGVVATLGQQVVEHHHLVRRANLGPTSSGICSPDCHK